MLTSFRNLAVVVLVSVAVVLMLVIGAYFYGSYKTKQQLEAPRVEITSQVILDKINDQCFVVTKTLFLDEEATIEIKNDSSWNNLLWGQKIDTEGTVRVDIGVDMKELQSEDIIVDHNKKAITIFLPPAEVLDSSLYGDLEIKTQNGILKALFDNDEGADYNLAVRELIKIAEGRANQDTQLLEEGRADSVKLITLILNDLGYTVSFE